MTGITSEHSQLISSLLKGLIRRKNKNGLGHQRETKLHTEVGVAPNSSQVSQVVQGAQFALRTMAFFSLLRNLRCALCLFFSACAICVALYAFFFSACAICVCESVNLIFVAL